MGGPAGLLRLGGCIVCSYQSPPAREVRRATPRSRSDTCPNDQRVRLLSAIVLHRVRAGRMGGQRVHGGGKGCPSAGARGKRGARRAGRGETLRRAAGGPCAAGG